MEELNTFLLSIGLGKNEATVYSALIGIGDSSVLELSKKTKLHRSNIYDSLRKLIQRGLVYEIGNSTKLFAARSPESLQSYLKEKEIELEDIIKKGLFSSMHKETGDNIIKISKGVFAMRQILFGFLETKEPIMVFGVPKESYRLLGPVLREVHKQRIKNKIPMFHIFNSNAIDRAKTVSKMKYTQARVFPPKFDTSVTTNVCGEKVVITLWEGEIIVIEINLKSLAEVYKKYFEVLWSKSKKVF